MRGVRGLRGLRGLRSHPPANLDQFVLGNVLRDLLGVSCSCYIKKKNKKRRIKRRQRKTLRRKDLEKNKLTQKSAQGCERKQRICRTPRKQSYNHTTYAFVSNNGLTSHIQYVIIVIS